MDAFELLTKDHKKVSQLFKEVEAASGQAKKQIFSRLKTELDVHANTEERIFYPALENKEAARDITLEAYEEHKVVKELLAELESSDPTQDQWDAKLTVLKENVEHHVEEEEGELFSKARQALSKQEIEDLGVEMEAEKASQLAGASRTERSTGSSGTAGKRAGRAPTQKSKSSESPGVLARLANLVGLGGSSTSKKDGTKRASTKAGKKTRTAAATSKTKSSKTSKKAAKKSAAKSTKAARLRSTTKKTAARSGAKQTQRRTTKNRGRSR